MSEMLRVTFGLIGLLAVLATVPGAIELLLVTSGLVRRERSTANAKGETFSMAVVIPAHNEEAMIERCIESVAASSDGLSRCSIVVVADNCQDATAERAHLASARVLERHDLSNRGKGFALRFAFDRLLAEGFDGFLVVDADSVVSSNVVPEVARFLAAGADGVQTRYRVTEPLDSNSKRLMDVALMAFNVLRPKGRFGWGLSAGILGNGFGLSRQTLLDVPYSAESIVEDLEYHLLCVSAHKRIQFINGATVYGDMPNDESARVSQRARWEGGRARVARVWIPKLVSRLLNGNFLVIEPLLELLTLPLAYFVLASMLLLVLPFRGLQFYGVGLLILLAAHVGIAVILGGNIRASFQALASAPAYLFWKLCRMPATIKSARPASQWLRTGRATDTKSGLPHV